MKGELIVAFILASSFSTYALAAETSIKFDSELDAYFSDFQSVPFDQDKWRTGKTQRFTMLFNFICDHQPIGKSRDEICKLLGLPESSENSIDRYCLQSGPVCGWVSIPKLELEYEGEILTKLRILKKATGAPNSSQADCASHWISKNLKRAKSY